ncbi:hypothetical protein LWC34_06575 [Kibdelosporangium philippinense]|uniref:Secreted protein n=1 Tax=Kibdelosporangium philippinense TaxID=211113 RepID=A0ABS8Z3I6_9PSEU|nr:hypothetical protein [Kibdelosporangium philippinense]MCE7002496.1 hypothetical protein [Kibdelosporangium philippinense]
MLRKIICATAVGLAVTATLGTATASAAEWKYQGRYISEYYCTDAGARGVWDNRWKDFKCSPFAGSSDFALWTQTW